MVQFACRVRQGYKHKLIICNTYCFYTGAITQRTRLNLTLYVHFLPAFIIDVVDCV